MQIKNGKMVNLQMSSGARYRNRRLEVTILFWPKKPSDFDFILAMRDGNFDVTLSTEEAIAISPNKLSKAASHNRKRCKKRAVQ